MEDMFRLYTGDCLTVMDEWPSVKTIVADPPYMIGIKSDMYGKINPWADLMNGAVWYAAWMDKCRKHLTQDGCLWVFSNWRGLPALIKAAYDIKWGMESLLIWDKGCFGLGTNRGLRPTYEMVALLAMPEFAISNRALADIQLFRWTSRRPHGHTAEKPEELMRFLIEHSTQPGDTVADPFMGSGTTGAAAVSIGRRFIGADMDAGWVTSAGERIAAAKHNITSIA